jgi:two-component system OmpR family sensor kinase
MDLTNTPTRQDHNRLLTTLEQLLAIDATELEPALDQASDLLIPALHSDKIDVFLHDPATDSLVAFGTSHTPMGEHQKATGLDHLPIANGGRTVEAYQTGKTFATGRADQDPAVLPGIKHTLGVRSMLVAPLYIGGDLRGVLSAVSARPDQYTGDDLRFIEAVSRWVGALAHRAELVESLKQHVAEEARKVTAEQLVTVLAHDLGNYLTPALGRVDLIRRHARRESNDRYLQAAEVAYSALAQIRILIRDLLDVSRLKQGLFSLSLQPVDLTALARETVDLLSAADANITLRAPDCLPVKADPIRLRQAIENLLNNALKHGPEGVPVHIELTTRAQQDGQYAIITVSDEGPGITPELLPNIFTPFTSGPGSTGLGLGLYLAHSIAHAHNGTLTVESAPGKGATFRLSLPQTA